MPIIRKQLKPSDVYPDNIRYNEATDTVQSLINGEWVDNPQADPRHQTTYPPRITSNPACDAAQSVTDAFKNQIDGILEAIDGGQTAFSIAALILGLFTFGVFDIFIAIALAIANAMLDAGTAAIEASLTPEAYDAMTCALFCRMDSQGRITAENLAIAQGDISANVGGIGAIVLNAMLSLAGEGGVNNLASIGTSTGDCDDCDCNLCELDLWSHVGLGTEVERGDDYVTIEAANIPGLYGNWRAEIDTTDKDICCRVGEWEILIGDPAAPTYKYMLCGVPFVDEGSYAHGIPSVGTECWAIGLDASSPFTIKFKFV